MENTLIKLLVSNDYWKLLNNFRAKDTVNLTQKELVNINRTGNFLQSTDGARAIKIKFDGLSDTLPEGSYKVLSTTKYLKHLTELILEPSQLSFPDLKSVWISDERVLLYSILSLADDPFKISRELVKIYEKTGRIINYKFLNDIAGNFGYNWAVYARDAKIKNDDSLLFTVAPDIEAMIMPIK